MKNKLILFLLMLTMVVSGCSRNNDTTEGTGKLRVVTSFYPMYLLAQAVTEGAAELELMNMAQPQTGCLHDYELTISDMKLLERADVLIINGGGMESFLEQALERYPELVIVDTSHGIELLEEEELDEEFAVIPAQEEISEAIIEKDANCKGKILYAASTMSHINNFHLYYRSLVLSISLPSL